MHFESGAGGTASQPGGARDVNAHDLINSLPLASFFSISDHDQRADHALLVS